MAGLPESPEEAVRYALAFLPGFIALGLVMYLTNLVLTEFEFAYLAVTVSVAIYIFVNAIAGRLKRRFPERKWEQPLALVRLSLLAGVTVLFSLTAALLYESHLVIGALRAVAPETLIKVSTRSPLHGVMASEARGLLYKEIDDRPVEFRLRTKEVVEAGQKFQVIASYALYVRVYLEKDRVYEGRIRRFEMDKSKEGFPIVLTPACRIEAAHAGVGAERIGRIFGPGVLVTGKDLKHMELYEAQASPCWRCFNIDKYPKQAGCFNVVPTDSP